MSRGAGVRWSGALDRHAQVPLSDHDLGKLGGGVRVAVAGTLNGSPFRTRAFRMGGFQGIAFNKKTLAEAGVSPGDPVVVEVWRDDAPRVVEVPDDLAAALAEAGVRPAFDEMAFTHRREWVEHVTSAKRSETRDRRVAACVRAMEERTAR
jgi:hypothetical protein